jgi:hypothetical protein
VIVDLIVGPLLDLFSWVLNLIPDWAPDLPSNAGMVSRLGQVDSLVPIGPLVAVALGLLGFGLVFLTVRLIVFVRHVVLP